MLKEYYLFRDNIDGLVLYSSTNCHDLLKKEILHVQPVPYGYPYAVKCTGKWHGLH